MARRQGGSHQQWINSNAFTHEAMRFMVAGAAGLHEQPGSGAGQHAPPRRGSRG
ncbi:hypothetical protein [Luteimonas sp. 100069]|uniref:hypothetical protein n=1 Tax=Luteimonas sp. 100069 TaxID=2006109 RepID=UPI0013153D83|nr:hypothetical protein [Luteimonas sp. 100069]